MMEILLCYYCIYLQAWLFIHKQLALLKAIVNMKSFLRIHHLSTVMMQIPCQWRCPRRRFDEHRTNLYQHKYLFLYPPHRAYISFVNVFVTHKNNNLFLGDIWSTQNSKTFELCLSVRPCVRPPVVNTIASERKELETWKFAHTLLLPIRWLVLKMGYIGLQDLVPPI